MNIFVLDVNPEIAARMHCDRHVVKMILETAQILSTVWRVSTPIGAEYGIPAEAYKATHKNHPCVKWAGEKAAHYHWLWCLGMALCAEYTHRYGRMHKTEAVLRALETLPLAMGTLATPLPLFFQLCMPEDFASDYFAHLGTGYDRLRAAVMCYREFYRTAKAHLLTYTRRPVPEWIPASIATFKEG